MLIGMMALAALVGLLLGGRDGAILAPLVAGGTALAAPFYTPWLTLRLFGALAVPEGAAPELTRVLHSLAGRAELPTAPKLYYIPSATPNALSVGSRRASAVAVTDGLLRRLSGPELVAVLAHEVSHIRHGDLIVMAIADALARLTTMLSLIGLFLVTLATLEYGPALILPAALLILAPTVISILQAALSRSRELDADLGAVELTGDPLAMIRALERIDCPHRRLWEQLLGLPPRDGNPSILRSHPDTDERVARLRELLEQSRRVPKVSSGVIRLLEQPEVTRRPGYRLWGGWH